MASADEDANDDANENPNEDDDGDPNGDSDDDDENTKTPTSHHHPPHPLPIPRPTLSRTAANGGAMGPQVSTPTPPACTLANHSRQLIGRPPRHEPGSSDDPASRR